MSHGHVRNFGYFQLTKYFEAAVSVLRWIVFARRLVLLLSSKLSVSISLFSANLLYNFAYFRVVGIRTNFYAITLSALRKRQRLQRLWPNSTSAYPWPLYGRALTLFSTEYSTFMLSVNFVISALLCVCDSINSDRHDCAREASLYSLAK